MLSALPKREFHRPLLVLALAGILIVGPSLGLLGPARADGGEEAGWLLSPLVQGNLELVTDSSVPQWASARMSDVRSLDGVEMEVMSIHNDSYIVILVERPFSATADQAGVAIAFESTVTNSSDVVWAWVAEKNNSTDPAVVSMGILTGETLTVTFGRQVSGQGLLFKLEIGVPYEDGVHVASWSNGTALNLLDLEAAPGLGLELLPHLDLYPKAPFAYSAILVGATLTFVFLETRRYRR